MPWHRLAVSTVPAQPNAERLYDVSLRVLMAIVIVTLIGCVVFLAWRWLNPAPAPSGFVPLTAVERPAAEPARPADVAPTANAQVLLQPGQMYRCERNGRVTFSDQPCTEGAARVMSLPAAK
jgi:hypothetical protein